MSPNEVDVTFRDIKTGAAVQKLLPQTFFQIRKNFRAEMRMRRVRGYIFELSLNISPSVRLAGIFLRKEISPVEESICRLPIFQ